MAQVFVVEWANGKVDVFASREEAERAYPEMAGDDLNAIPYGSFMSVSQAEELKAATWSDGAERIREL